MTSFRIPVMAVALALLAAGSGGCPLADLATPTDLGQQPAGDDDSAAPPEQTTTLAEVASGIMEGDGGEELAWSYGSSWVYTGPGYSPDATYPPDFDPYGGGSGGTGGGAGVDEDNASGGSDGSDEGGPGPMFGPGSATYSGTVDCLRHESLEGYGELSEDMTLQVAMSFDEQGVPISVPFPLFIERIMVYADVRYVGDTDTFTVPFNATVSWTVTVRVVSAVYTTQTASIVLEIDTGWAGEHSSIIASGTHTLQTEVVGEALNYSSDTHYEAEFRAADDWEGHGTEDFDCTGTLPRQ
jgi:hypothetical protein